jgi:hypothetical protein
MKRHSGMILDELERVLQRPQKCNALCARDVVLAIARVGAKSVEKVNEILVTLERMNSPLGEVLRNKLAGRDGRRL